MKNLLKKLTTALMICSLMLTFGTVSAAAEEAQPTLNVVATTTMLADLVEVIGGNHVSVNGLMGPGVDPHLYQANAGDMSLLMDADAVIYNGLHLEGKMGDIFAALQNPTICIEDGLDYNKLLPWDETDEDGNAPTILTCGSTLRCGCKRHSMFPSSLRNRPCKRRGLYGKL